VGANAGFRGGSRGSFGGGGFGGGGRDYSQRRDNVRENQGYFSTPADVKADHFNYESRALPRVRDLAPSNH
jgi:hypothetical protein